MSLPGCQSTFPSSNFTRSLASAIISLKINELLFVAGLRVALTRALRARRARPPEVAELAALQPRAQRAKAPG